MSLGVHGSRQALQESHAGSAVHLLTSSLGSRAGSLRLRAGSAGSAGSMLVD